MSFSINENEDANPVLGPRRSNFRNESGNNRNQLPRRLNFGTKFDKKLILTFLYKKSLVRLYLFIKFTTLLVINSMNTLLKF